MIEILDRNGYKSITKVSIETNGTLYKYHQEAQTWLNEVSLLKKMLNIEPKIKNFYNLNAIRLNTLFMRIKGLHVEYFEHEDGNVKYDADKKKILLEGKTQAQYQEEFNKLMAEPVSIKF